eukprot:4842341-Amphidinium_carterae.1
MRAKKDAQSTLTAASNTEPHSFTAPCASGVQAGIFTTTTIVDLALPPCWLHRSPSNRPDA